MNAFHRLTAALSIAVALTSAPAERSGAQEDRPGPGKFLVSSPELTGSAFGTSVVLLAHHDDNGTIGVIVNRPTNIAASTAFPESEALESYDGIVYYGGPVAPARPVFLIRSRVLLPEGNIPVLADVYLQGDVEAIENLPPEIMNPTQVRIYAGHAEWGPGQLEAEIATGSWQITDAETSQVFSADPLALWREVQLRGAAEVVRARR